MGSHATPQPMPDPRREEDVHPLNCTLLLYSAISPLLRIFTVIGRGVFWLFLNHLFVLSLSFPCVGGQDEQIKIRKLTVYFSCDITVPWGQQLTITGRHRSANLQPSLLGAGSSTGRSPDGTTSPQEAVIRDKEKRTKLS